MNLENSETMPNELASIYISTFSHVGQKFLDSLMEQITIQTQVTSTILIQLLSLEEYKELSNIKKQKFHLLPTAERSRTASSSPELLSSHIKEEPQQQQSGSSTAAVDDLMPAASSIEQQQQQDQFLLIRSCYSTCQSTIDSM